MRIHSSHSPVWTDLQKELKEIPRSPVSGSIPPMILGTVLYHSVCRHPWQCISAPITDLPIPAPQSMLCRAFWLSARLAGTHFSKFVGHGDISSLVRPWDSVMMAFEPQVKGG
jgi:hypothetical protein